MQDNSSRLSTARVDAAREAREAADNLNTFLNLAGWREVLLPAILKYREALMNSLYESEMGVQKHLENGAVTSPQNIAGRIAGLDDVLALVESIARRGENAQSFLNSQQSPAGNDKI